MSAFKELKRRFRSSPCLLADARSTDAALVPRREAMKRIGEAGLFGSLVVMDLETALANFATLVGEADREFTMKDIATITGEPYSKVNYYVTEGLLTPTITDERQRERKFDWATAFAAGVAGSLRRQGLPLDLVRNVCVAVAGETSDEPKEATATN